MSLKLYMVKRNDRVVSPSAAALSANGMRAATVKVGQVVIEVQHPFSSIVAQWHESRDGIKYVMCASEEDDTCSFLIPRDDLQEMPTDVDSILKIIIILTRE